MTIARAVPIAALLALVSTTAMAQQRTGPRPQPGQVRTPARPMPKHVPVERLHVEIDGIYHAATQSMTDSASPTVYAETASLTASYDVPAGTAFSGSATLRLWRNVGIGVGVTSFSTSFPASVTGSIPYPFQFNQARTFEGNVSSLERKELAIAMHLRGMFQLSPRLTASVFAGPSRLSLTQDVITAIQYSEAYPFDTATFSAVAIGTGKVNQWAASAGADLAYYVTRNVGIGVGAKYSGATAELISLGGAGLSSKIGGAELGGGLRIRF